MPSTKQEKIHFQRASSDLYGGEPLGEPPLPGARGAFSGLSEERVEEAIERSRLSRAVSELDQDHRAELLDGLLEQLGSERGELREAVTDRLLDGLIAGKRGEAELLGADGVLGELTAG